MICNLNLDEVLSWISRYFSTREIWEITLVLAGLVSVLLVFASIVFVLLKKAGLKSKEFWRGIGIFTLVATFGGFIFYMYLIEETTNSRFEFLVDGMARKSGYCTLLFATTYYSVRLISSSDELFYTLKLNWGRDLLFWFVISAMFFTLASIKSTGNKETGTRETWIFVSFISIILLEIATLALLGGMSWDKTERTKRKILEIN